MCRISYEKCACFVFLVILAVSSCSGFRIDDLAMTDVVSSSKRNYFVNADDGHPVRHHHRQSRAHHQQQQHQNRAPQQQRNQQQGRIDVSTYNLPQWPTNIPSERFAQLPATESRPHFLAPTRAGHHHHKPNYYKKNPACQDLVFWTRAHRAGVVVVANAEAVSILGTSKTKHFKVVERLKNATDYATFPLDDQVKISDNDSYTLNTKYILFLDRNGPHNYTVVADSVKARKKYINTISKFHFRTRPVKVEKLERFPTKRRLKLVCRVKGQPIPCITWKRNDEDLQANRRVRITYKKRKSTLVIKNFAESDWGWYECSAQGALNSTSSERILVESTGNTTGKPSENPENGMDCNESFKKDYCLNGGSCFYEESMNIYGCRCATGFTGRRCELKMSDQPIY